MKYANFRNTLKNRCEPCQCRTRSHFFFCDNEDTYNVDTRGNIWYQAAGSFEWSKIYQCRNYIPWQSYVSRLDHVMRNEIGGTADYRFSSRIPCGRPMSGDFIGFQTDINACVLFKNGQKVYEGKYRSDCDGAIGFNNQHGLDFFGAATSYYHNWLTTEGCNNNDPHGNDTSLYRNTHGSYDENWNFTPSINFVKGDVTPMLTLSRIDGEESGETSADLFGWGLATDMMDCCGNSPIDGETGFHLGTNETGSTVWFTTDKKGEKWFRFAGQVDSAANLPDMINLKNWTVVDEQDAPKTPTTLQDMDVIVVGSGSIWTCKPFYLKDFQWHDTNKDTYADLMLSAGTGVIFHESAEPIVHCNDTPDCWMGNIQSIQACGDVVLVNANQKGVDRVLVINGKAVLRVPAIDPLSSLSLIDGLECAFSKYYLTGLPEELRTCEDTDYVSFIKITQADGRILHIIAYNGAITWQEATAAGEDWTCGLTGDTGLPNVYFIAIGRTVNGNAERKVFYKGNEAAYYTYDYSLLDAGLGQSYAIPTGIIGSCGAVFQCPKQSRTDPLFPRGSIWDTNGTQLIACSNMYTWRTGSLIWGVAPFEPGTSQPKKERITNTYSYNTYSYNGCTRVGTSTTTVKEIIEYSKAYVPGLATTMYTGGSLIRETYRNDVLYNRETFTAQSRHYIPPNSYPSCSNPIITPTVGNLQYFAVANSLAQFFDFLPEPPQVVNNVKIVDNSLDPNSYDHSVSVAVSTNFACLFGLFESGASPTEPFGMITQSTIHKLKFNPSSGMGLCAFNPDQSVVMQDEYEVPIYNRIFLGGGSGLALYQGGFDETHEAYSHLLVSEDVDGYNTGRWLLNDVVHDCAGGWQQTICTSAEEVTGVYFALTQEKTSYTDDYGYTSTYVEKYTTHVYFYKGTIEPNPGGGYRFVNQQITDYLEDIVSGGGYNKEYGSYENADITKTLFYKICTQGCNKIRAHCGYIIEMGDENDTISFTGTVIYTSPNKTAGSYEITGCCEDAFMLIISETIGGITTRYVFIEGNEVWSSDNPEDEIAIIRCCKNGENRYALLGINHLNEELVNYNGEFFDAKTCNEYPPGDPQLVIDAMADAANHTITLTDGTIATPVHATADWVQEFGTGNCYPACWYDLYQTPDGVLFEGLYRKGVNPGSLTEGWSPINEPIYDNIALAKKQITDNRTRTIYHNGQQIASNKNYDGIFCCGNFMLSAYVDDEYKSGWWNRVDTGSKHDVIERKHNPFPGFGDALPPAANAYTEEGLKKWNYYNRSQSPYRVAVFAGGTMIADEPVNDVNSPIHYDHLNMPFPWLLFGLYFGGVQMNIGNYPLMMEGHPICGSAKVLIPHDDGLTTVTAGESSTRHFI
jgi:hypothetical protein